MELKKILKTCLAKMGEQDFVDKETLTEAEQDTLSRLVEAFNIAYTNAVAEYLPLITEDRVNVVDGKVDCTRLNKQLIYATKLYDKNGAKHRFRLMPTTIVTDFSGEATLEYAYAPDRVEIDGVVNDVRLTKEVLADGTLATYYFSLRSYDLSSAYYDDFSRALSKLKNKGREIVVKERRWGA